MPCAPALAVQHLQAFCSLLMIATPFFNARNAVSNGYLDYYSMTPWTLPTWVPISWRLTEITWSQSNSFKSTFFLGWSMTRSLLPKWDHGSSNWWRSMLRLSWPQESIQSPLLPYMHVAVTTFRKAHDMPKDRNTDTPTKARNRGRQHADAPSPPEPKHRRKSTPEPTLDKPDITDHDVKKNKISCFIYTPAHVRTD